MRIHCEKTSLYATFWLTWTCPRANVLMAGRVFIKLAHIISYVCARPTCFHAVCRLRDVSCACSRTNRRVSAHFLSYEVIFMRNVKHMTPCLLPNSPQTSRNDVQPHDLTYEPFLVATFHIRNHVWEHWFDRREVLRCVITVKRGSTAQLFVLHRRVRMKIFSWEDMSVYNLSHNFLFLFSTDMFPRTVSTTRRVHVRVRALKRLMSAHFSN